MPQENPWVLLILAAGRSTRFTDGHKLLAGIDGVPILARTIRQAKDSGVGRILVVTGHERPAIEALARGEGAATTFNPDYRDGMGSSIAAGVRASIARDAGHLPAGWLIWPGDMPFVRPDTVRTLVHSTDSARPLVPTVGGRRGHPVLFPPSFRDRLVCLSGDVGARSLLAEAAEIETGDPGILRDLDTRGELVSPG